MRTVWIGMFGLIAAAALTWLLWERPSSSVVENADAPLSTPADVEGGPALKGALREAPSAVPSSGEGRYLIRGQVLLAEGDVPLAGMTVEIRRNREGWPGQGYAAVLAANDLHVRTRATALLAGVHKNDTLVGTTVSGDDGRFTYRVDRAQYHTVTARPDAEGAAGGSDVAHLIPKIREVTDVTVYIFAGVPLQGRVEDAQGQPVVAQVRARHRPNRHRYYDWHGYAQTDAKTGTFAFDRVADAALTFQITLPTGQQYSGFSAAPPFDEPVVLTLPGGRGRVDGTVRTEDGEAVDKALVTLQLELPKDETQDKQTITLAARTADDGHFTIEGLPPGEITRTGATADGYLAKSQFKGRGGFASIPVPENGAANVDLTLRRGSSVFGRVTRKDDGKAIAGATVTLYYLAWHPPQTIERTTDAQGHYRFDGLGDGKFMVLATHPDHFVPEIESALTQTFAMGDRKAPPHLAMQLTALDQEIERDLVLAKGTSIRGVVLDPNGTPAADARVYLKNHGLRGVSMRWGFHMQGDEPPATVASADGTFAIDGLAPRTDWVLYGRKVGFAGVYTDPISLADGPQDVTLRLVKQCVVRGRVLDAHGQPMADQSITVSGYTTLRGGDWRFKSQADGSFEIDSMPAEGYLNLSVRKGDESVAVKVENLTPGEVREGVELRFGGSVEITGTIRNSEGEPLPGILMTVSRLDGVSEHRQTGSAKDGSFTFKNISPGRVQIYVHGVAQAVTEPFDAPATNVDITFEPPKRTQIEGTVLAPDGSPVAYALVSGASATKGGSGVEIQKGAFKVTVEGKPPFSITINNPRAADGTPLNAQVAYVGNVDPSQPLTIRLKEGATLAGRVVDGDNSALAGVRVEAMGKRTESDSEGAWKLIGLPPQRVSVTARPPAGFIKPEAIVAEPNTTGIEFRMEKGVSISGRVTVPDDVKLLGGSVGARWERQGGYGAGSARGSLQRSGAFSVEGVPPDVITTLEVNPYQPQDAKVRVAPTTVPGIKSGRKDVAIALEVGAVLTGTVVTADGKAFSDGTISLRGNGTGWARLDKSGRFEVAGLRPGTYDLLVFKGPKPVNTAVKVTVPATDVRIVLPERGTISGTLTGVPKGQRWVVMAVRADTGASSGLAQGAVESDGAWEVGPIDKDHTWVIVARRDDGASDQFARSKPVAVGARDVALTMQTGVTISGRVQRNGESVPETWVTATAPGWSSGTSADAEGHFVIRGLPAGRYKLTAVSWSLSVQGELEDVGTGSDSVVVEMDQRRN